MNLSTAKLVAFVVKPSNDLLDAVNNLLPSYDASLLAQPVTAQRSSYSTITAQVTLADENVTELRNALKELADSHSADIALLSQQQAEQHYKLACFDMDSTLIQAEVIDELAKHAGVGTQVAEITSRAMHGELDFKQSFAARMALLKGLPESVLQEIADSLPLMPGLEQLMPVLRARGIKTAILSGGFTYFAKHLQNKLGFDFVHANLLEIEQGKLTGKAHEPIVDGQRKKQLLEQIASEHNFALDQTIAVGDGANDLPMLGSAGLGVAFHAKPVVRKEADFAISVAGLEGLIDLLPGVE